MSIKLYYQNSEDNFGDVLSKEVVSFLSGEEVVWSPLKKADIVAIGSLGERVALKKMKRFFLCRGKSLDVWGTGFLEPGGQVSQRFVNIYALRGIYSRDRFDAGNVPLGDPGLLSSIVFPKDFKHHGAVVCLPHLHDRESEQWISEISNLYPNRQILTLSLSAPLEKIIAAIAGAEFVVSTAMHPLIVAQSYSVPFVWLEGDAKLHPGARYKFEDYFSVFGTVPGTVSLQGLLTKASSVSDFSYVMDSSMVSIDKIHLIQQDLIAAFPGQKR